MAARRTTKSAHALQDAAATPETLLNDWSETQIDLLGATFGRMAEIQQATLSAWFALLTGSAAPWAAAAALWSSPTTVATASLDAARSDPLARQPEMSRWLDAWWSHWLPFVQRGGEQLG